MATFSFDIVSDYDKAELNNVFDQTKREITNRYDFKNTPADIDWLNDDKSGFLIAGNSNWQVDAILDIIRKKLAARNQSQKLLDTSSELVISNLKTTKQVPFKKGLDQEKSKKITNLIRDSKSKVKATIQGDLVRVSGNSKDDLQRIITLLKEQEFDFPLQFINYR